MLLSFMRVSSNVVSSDDLKFHVCSAPAPGEGFWKIYLSGGHGPCRGMTVRCWCCLCWLCWPERPGVKARSAAASVITLLKDSGAKHFWVNFRPRGFQSNWLQPLGPKARWRFVPACSKPQFRHFVIAHGDVSWRVQGYWCRRLRFTRHLELVIPVGAACHELPHRGFPCRFLSDLIDLRMEDRIGFWNRNVPLPLLFQPCTDTSRSFPMRWGCQTRKTQDPSSQSSKSNSIRFVEHHQDGYKRTRRGFRTFSLYIVPICIHLPWSLHWVLPWPIFSQAETRWMDATSCLAAERHCGRSAVTLAVSSGETATESTATGGAVSGLKVFFGSMAPCFCFKKAHPRYKFASHLEGWKNLGLAMHFVLGFFFESLWHLDGRIFGREKWAWNCKDVEADSRRPYSYGEPGRGAIRGFGSTSGPPSVHRTLANTFQVQSETSRNWENRSFL